MSKKVLDSKNRWRSKTVAFRVSPEEWEEIERLVAISGMSKQNYIMHRLQNTEMKIQANPRMVKAIRNEINELCNMVGAINSLPSDDSLVERLSIIPTVLTEITND